MLKIKIISGLILLGISGISYAQYANVEKLNESASCDSTCSLDPNKVQTLSGQTQKLGSCGYGYVGSSLEERIVKPDGTWSDWRVVNRDNCACSPLTENQEVDCPINQKGTHIQTRDWTCPSVAQGAYTQWVTKSNTCSYYYLNTSTEEQEISCPANQRGIHVQTRNYENWSDSSKRNYTTWTTKSNTCNYYLIAASQTETGSIACPSGYTGTINQVRTYDRWSDGGARNHSAWTEVSRNCILASINFYGNLLSESKNYTCTGNGCTGNGAMAKKLVFNTPISIPSGINLSHPRVGTIRSIGLNTEIGGGNVSINTPRPSMERLAVSASGSNYTNLGVSISVKINDVPFTLSSSFASNYALVTEWRYDLRNIVARQTPIKVEILY